VYEIYSIHLVRIEIHWNSSIFSVQDLNGDGFVDRNEFNQVIKDKAESFHERQIKFFKKVLTRDDTDKVSYQRKD
jgi:Ca2+-binding EF-hand superfamily protein